VVFPWSDTTVVTVTVMTRTVLFPGTVVTMTFVPLGPRRNEMISMSEVFVVLRPGGMPVMVMLF
jgi:hypothetical protein